MARKILAEHVTGKRTINGTEWPICNQLVRDQRPGQRPTWEIVRSLCNGVPDHVDTYPTRRAALEDWPH